MTNLIEQVGHKYFTTKFSGCMLLLPDSTAGWISGGSNERGVPVKKVCGSPEKFIETNELLPLDFFSGLEVFLTPQLGYRTSHSGRFLCYFSRNNTGYTRGVSSSNLKSSYSPHTDLLVFLNKLPRNKIASNAFLSSVVLTPKFTPVTEGVERLNSGNILSFAVNPDIAVVPQSDTEYNVMLRQNKIGHLTPECEFVSLPEFSDMEIDFT